MNIDLLRWALAALFVLPFASIQAADTTPPAILSMTPAPGSTVSNLTQINVLFTEPVVGVQNWNLQINGNDANSVAGVGFTNFTFSFTQPLPGVVPVNWDPIQAITDQAGNPFATPSAW